MKWIILFFLNWWLVFNAIAQDYEWAALTDCGGNINATASAITANNEVFVAGKFNGETYFYSSQTQDTVIKKIGKDGNSQPNFLACYNVNGKVNFVYKIDGGNYLEIRTMLSFIDNSVLIFCNVESSITINGIKAKTIDGKDATGSVFRINGDGKIILAKKINNSYVLNATCDLVGNVYCFSYIVNNYGGQNKIYKYDKEFNEIGTIEIETASLKTLSHINEKIYAVIENTYSNGTMYNEKTFPYKGKLPISINHLGLCELNFATKEIKLLQSWKIPFEHSYNGDVALHYKSIINYYNQTLFVNLFLYTNNSSYNFIDNKIIDQAYSSRVFQLGTDGSVKKTESFKGGYYNTNISVNNKGELYIVFPMMDSLKTEKGLIISESYSQFVNELIYIKLNKNLRTEWVLKGGGTASVYNQSIIQEGPNGKIYTLNNIYNYAKLGVFTFSPKWHSAYYISCIKN